MIQVKNLSLEYPDKKRALNDISFSLGAKENVALVGANGAGKTSLLLALSGVLPSKGGEIFLDDRPLNKKNLPYFRKKIGLIFQNPENQLFMPNVYEDVAFGPRGNGYSEEDTAAMAINALKQLQILPLKERSPLRLSGGEKRLAAIATVLSMQPDYLLFDEPTAFLDPKSRRNLQNIVNDLPQGKLIATHDLPFALATCAKVIILKEGEIITERDINCLKDELLLESSGL